ncbi:MAG TPA: hypothetical protein VFE63_12370 [Roseiarcus sp.]|nr:hypothetical protein [Roseiarcus sp.]
MALGIASAILLWPGIGMSEAGGPFAAFLGSWRGSGQATIKDGHHERIGCRAKYSGSDSGQSLTISLVCASDSYRFNVESYVEAQGQNIHGHWEETTRKVQGDLSGRVEGGQFKGTVTGGLFSVDMSIRATERAQTVSMVPHGADVTDMEIVLNRQ